MLTKQDVTRIISDLVHTEIAAYSKDPLVVYEKTIPNFSTIPNSILKEIHNKVGKMFSFEWQEFLSFWKLVGYAYNSFLKNKKITMLTSGSTGIPKSCMHSLDDLVQEAQGVSFLFKGIKRIVSLVPASHMYGLTFTVMLPHVLNVPVVSVPPLPIQNWSEILESGDLFVGFPLFWGQWVSLKNQFPPNVQALSATAPCKDEIIDGLVKCGITSFTEIYGASETGAIAFRKKSNSTFELLPFWEMSQEKTQIEIVRTNSPIKIPFPDNVSLVGNRAFIVNGRKDFCVQVAGINVYPKHIENVLKKSPFVKDCIVRLMRPNEGNRLKAFLVLRDNIPANALDTIRKFAKSNLTVHEQPKSYTVGTCLPHSATGKLADW